MPSLASVIASNASLSPLTRPVAIFLGGTSGIGQGTAEAFARHTGGNAHIIIIGRNRAAAETIISSFPKNPDSTYEFVHCEANSIRNVARTTSELAARLPKVNYVVMTNGGPPSILNILRGKRTFTEEGIDTLSAVNYFSRAKFASDLVPLLKNAKEAGEDARVLSVLAAGNGSPIDPDDMGMQKGRNVLTLRGKGVTYMDMLMETLAARVPSATFTHTYPGAVNTPLFPTWLSVLAYPVLISMRDSGEYMLYALLNGGPGAQRRGPHGDDLGTQGYCGSDTAREQVRVYTEEVIERALATGSAPASAAQ